MATTGTKHYRDDEAIAYTTDVLKKLLDKSKTSRSELAQMLGITIPQVTNALSGEADIRISTVARIVKALGYSFVISPKKVAEPNRPEPKAEAPKKASKPAAAKAPAKKTAAKPTKAPAKKTVVKKKPTAEEKANAVAAAADALD